MFPNSTDITLDNESNTTNGTKSYMFDFENGDFIVCDGKLIECDGIKSIKVWIKKYSEPRKADTLSIITPSTAAIWRI